MLPGKKSSWAHVIFIHIYQNEIVDKIKKQPKKHGKNEILHFWVSGISVLVQIGSSSFQAS